MTDYPPDFLALLSKITAKCAKTVIDHILKHDYITAEDLKETYGYNHPPRAARDVREQGIPLETTKVRNAQGRTIGAYKFGDLSQIAHNKLGGRQVFSKALKNELYEKQGGRCAVCHQEYVARYMQIDHRVPYEVAGDSEANEADASIFMAICASCQRSKSWTCEHCDNLINRKNPSVCRTCYWGSPERYKHIALTPARREVITWIGDGVKDYEKIRRRAKAAGLSIPEYIRSKAEEELK